jgi:SAM-dependent methyltransferase
LLHLADPDRAVAEASRVLRPGGRYAFTVWAGPDRHEFFRMVLKAVHDHADANVALPPAPPVFRFADPAECRRVLAGAGFVDVSISEIPLVMHAGSVEGILDFIYKGTVRTSMMLERQTAAARERVHLAIRETARSFVRPGGYDIGWTAVVVAAGKPA